MNHETATQLQASERYVLGQLTPVERDEFEDHLADCSFCMEDVSATEMFAANARAVFQDKAAGRAVPASKRWWDFLRVRQVPVLAFSGGLNIALLGFLGYGMLRVMPTMQTQLAQQQRPGITSEFRLAGATRGPVQVFTVNRSNPFAIVRFDNPEKHQKYSYTLDGNGVQREGEISLASDADTLSMIVPVTGLEPGEYRVKLSGRDGVDAVEIGRYILRIE
jgi:hypothetical protein